MEPYFLIFFILISFLFFDNSKNKNNRNVGLLFSYILLLFFIGTRDKIGTDWIFYSNHYSQLLSGRLINNYNFEIGYEYIAYIFSLASFSYHAFLFVFTSVYLLLFFIAFSNLKRPNLSVLLFYSIYLIALMGTSRQLMALSLVAISMIYMEEDNKPKVIFFILLAALFHTSALILLLTLLYKKEGVFRRRNIFYLILMLFTSIVFSELLFEILYFLLSFSDKLSIKLTDYLATDDKVPIFFLEDKTFVWLMFIKKFIILFFIYLVVKSNNNYFTRLSMKLYITGFIIFASLYSILPAIAIRLSIYFTFFEIYAISNSFSNRIITKIIVLFFLSLSFFTLYSVLNGVDSDLLIPYKSIFWNTDVRMNIR